MPTLKQCQEAYDAREPPDPNECEEHGCDWRPIGGGFYKCRVCGAVDEI